MENQSHIKKTQTLQSFSFGEWFPIPVAILAGLGLLMVYSASLSSKPGIQDQVYFLKHLLFLTIGGTLGLLASRLNAKQWYRFAPLIYFGVLGLLVITLIPLVGVEVNGARRWLRFGPVSFQPSEFAKIALPLALCYLGVKNHPRNMRDIWPIGGVLLAVLPMLVLVAMEPDLGTTIFLVGGAAVVLFVSAWPLRFFVGSAVMLIPAVVLTAMANPYQWKRVTGLLSTLTDLKSAPYQLKQSLVSLGSGGLSGVGLGNGTQKLSFLPEANNDFVFSVVGEELGLIGTLGVIVAWTAVFVLGWYRLKTIRHHKFAYPLAFTMLTQIVVQAALNIAVVVAIVPPKGISHPLLSAGGSGLIVTLIALGMFYGLTESSEDSFDFTSAKERALTSAE